MRGTELDVEKEPKQKGKQEKVAVKVCEFRNDNERKKKIGELQIAFRFDGALGGLPGFGADVECREIDHKGNVTPSLTLLQSVGRRFDR